MIHPYTIYPEHMLDIIVGAILYSIIFYLYTLSYSESDKLLFSTTSLDEPVVID